MWFFSENSMKFNRNGTTEKSANFAAEFSTELRKARAPVANAVIKTVRITFKKPFQSIQPDGAVDSGILPNIFIVVRFISVRDESIIKSQGLCTPQGSLTFSVPVKRRSNFWRNFTNYIRRYT